MTQRERTAKSQAIVRMPGTNSTGAKVACLAFDSALRCAPTRPPSRLLHRLFQAQRIARYPPTPRNQTQETALLVQIALKLRYPCLPKSYLPDDLRGTWRWGHALPLPPLASLCSPRPAGPPEHCSQPSRSLPRSEIKLTLGWKGRAACLMSPSRCVPVTGPVPFVTPRPVHPEIKDKKPYSWYKMD
eukprot:1757913-Rhodomonas_salina.4